MSCPPPLQSPKRQVSFGTTREREFCKYLPSYHLSLPLSQHVSADSPCPQLTRPCPDTVLTAFAQLGALRLNAERVFISLFGKHNQHILAEASRTLSLQDDNEFDEDDELWMGCCTVAYERSFCKNVCELYCAPRCWEEKAFVVPDLQKDDRFSEAVDVKYFPHLRFLACVPIVSPKGVVIGAYTVMDTKPRPPLDKRTIKFLCDMSVTVMSHLDTNRSKTRHLRSERMVVGLGSFLEGKASLRSSWLESSEHPCSGDLGEPLEGHINARQQAKQALADSERALHEAGFTRRLPLRSRNPRPSDDQDIRPCGKLLSNGVTTAENATRSQSVPKWSSVKELPEQNATTGAGRHDTYDIEVRQTFSRAANIVRESLAVEGAAFFDANFASHGGLVNNAKSETDYSDTDSAMTSDDNGTICGGSSAPNDGHATNLMDESNPCNILGFSTTSASSINYQPVGDKRMTVSESFMKGLLHRYPRGKIFNFAEDGTLSSGDTSDALFQNFKADSLGASLGDNRRKRGRKYKKTGKTMVRQDVYTLRQFAPGSRSIIFVPLWDSHKGRWYSGCLVWTKTPLRVFTRDDELTFLFAFGHSVMAEVHRLGYDLAERAKSDLLASISHELRSPLHGVFGTAELLAETSMNAFQLGMVHTIESCASTLFDSINHLLEYANINNMRKGRPLGGSSSNGDYFNLPPDKGQFRYLQGQEGPPNLNPSIQLDAVLEEVVESVFAGYAFLNGSRSPLRKPSTPGGVLSVIPTLSNQASGRVKLVLDINHSINWKFVTQAGAWRLILMNILGNALKFTQEGLIYVTLDASPIDAESSSADAMSQVTLTVKDTGTGISQKYLQDDIFGAFSKENPLTPGTGLGLNITYRTVAALGGDIQVYSQNGLGTEVITRVSLPQSLEIEPDGIDQLCPVVETKELVRGTSIGILGFGESEQDIRLRSSTIQLCQGWFDMNVVELDVLQNNTRHCDFYITTQEYMELDDQRIRSIPPGPTRKFASSVVVICPSPGAARAMFTAARARGDLEVIEFISQPCGPRKLAKTLKTCCLRQRGRQRLSTAETRLLVPFQQDGKYHIPPIPEEAHDSDFTLKGMSVRVKDASPLESSNQSDASTTDPDQDSSPATSAQVPGSLSPETTPSPTSPPRVLIVDDNEINVKLLEAFMRKLGCESSIARNGLEAVESFKAQPKTFSIILMDISMPVMDGLESTRQIREFEKQLNRVTPVTIAALTGLAQAEVRRDAIASGMDIFLTKPVRLKSLQPIFEGRGLLRSPSNSDD
ncbi:hypothetical protein P170DRAFT_385449 [Aspergillus steynii IBT 23096]|uniref:Sensor histidine kinase/response regulator n=1 Tax=Aspergillus steynii IBT 23096 TaxID=1392250 RepID=A0A2I2G413_9EURO|nr:uncharacterized protein P170DRAFT_385449 [Aspergillus steynii IBT 23096]PLB47620.1 hypothetical protein P170DRAFT_385449 [Aspergillus steynii IBT 23096]